MLSVALTVLWCHTQIGLQPALLQVEHTSYSVGGGAGGSIASSSPDFKKNPDHENGEKLFNGPTPQLSTIVHSLCNMFQQCISNIYNVFTNNSQNWLYTDFK